MTRKKALFWLIFFGNLFVFYLSLALGLVIRFYGDWEFGRFLAHMVVFTPVFFIWLLVFFSFGLFEVKVFRRYTTVISGLFSALAMSGLVTVLYFYIQPTLGFTPRRVLLLVLVVSLALCTLLYLLTKQLIKNRLLEYVYIFKETEFAHVLKKEIESQHFLGFRFVGFLNDTTISSKFKDVNVIVPEDVGRESHAIAELYQLRKQGVTFLDARKFYELLLRRISLTNLSELWFLENISYRRSVLGDVIKRLIDISFGFFGFLVFLISLPLIGLLIKLDSAGPILFIQNRVGRGGKVFKVYKYRTMSGSVTNTWTQKNDARITRLGKFLRRTRIDELPQMINLVLGNMSLVGPRPEQVHIVEELSRAIPFYDERHLVKPGITGWAQINDTYAATLEETKIKLEYDLYYVKNRSFLFDLEIILKTIYYILLPRGR